MHDIFLTNDYGFTVPFLLARQGIIPPEEWFNRYKNIYTSN